MASGGRAHFTVHSSTHITGPNWSPVPPARTTRAGKPSRGTSLLPRISDKLQEYNEEEQSGEGQPLSEGPDATHWKDTWAYRGGPLTSLASYNSERELVALRAKIASLSAADVSEASKQTEKIRLFMVGANKKLKSVGMRILHAFCVEDRRKNQHYGQLFGAAVMKYYHMSGTTTFRQWKAMWEHSVEAQKKHLRTFFKGLDKYFQTTTMGTFRQLKAHADRWGGVETRMGDRLGNRINLAAKGVISNSFAQWRQTWQVECVNERLFTGKIQKAIVDLMLKTMQSGWVQWKNFHVMMQFKETANPRDLQVLQDENNSLLEQMAQMKREFEDQLKEALDAGGSGQVESTNRESLDNLYTEIDKAKSERDHWQREYEMVRLERDTFESQYDEANNELKRLRVKAADDANQLEQARMTIEELHAQMTQMKQDVESLDIKSNQKQKMLQEITQREQAAQKQMKSAAISNKFKMGKDLVSKDKDRREKEQLQTLFDKTQEDLLDKQEVCAQLQDQLQHMKQQHASLAREKATFDQKEEAGMMRRAYLLQELTLKSRSVSELKLKNKELQKAIDRHNAKNPKWMRIGPKWALYATEGEGKTGGDAPQAPTE